MSFRNLFTYLKLSFYHLQNGLITSSPTCPHSFIYSASVTGHSLCPNVIRAAADIKRKNKIWQNSCHPGDSSLVMAFWKGCRGWLGTARMWNSAVLWNQKSSIFTFWFCVPEQDLSLQVSWDNSHSCSGLCVFTLKVPVSFSCSSCGWPFLPGCTYHVPSRVEHRISEQIPVETEALATYKADFAVDSTCVFGTHCFPLAPKPTYTQNIQANLQRRQGWKWDSKHHFK